MPHARPHASQPASQPDHYEFILGSSPTIVRRAADRFAGLTSWWIVLASPPGAARNQLMTNVLLPLPERS